MTAMQVCPVCDDRLSTNEEGAVALHYTTVGDICPMSGQPVPQWDEDSTRKSVRGRSMGICEWCGKAQATDMHHRMSRGVGGWWSPAQIIHLCRTCHAWVTQHPKEGYDSGLMVRSHQDPAQIPVQRPNGMALHLTDDITV